ncbi:MAG TPA: hypothetical protein VD866_28615, partial [Urbifossiella sp.]|nr:hypothetical protein [Urbifossiella sp.]
MTGDFRNWVARLFQSRTAARAANRRPGPRFRIETLEDRVVPATTITIQEAAGNLDSSLSATDGTVGAFELAGVPGTISRAALESVGPGVPISITAENSIFFDAPLSTISLQTDATTGAQFVASNGSVTFGNPANSLTTAGGDLTLVAISGVPALLLGNLATAGGDVNLVGDVVALDGTVDAGTGTVAVRPVTAGVDVTLGSEVGGTMSLTPAELGGITAGVLRVGDATTGDISVTAAITLGAGVPTLSLSSDDTITNTPNGSLSVANLRASSADGVTLDSAANDVDTLAGSATAVGASFSFTDADDLTIGVVDGTTGVSTADGPLTLVTGGALTIHAVLSASGGDLITLNSAGPVTQAAGVPARVTSQLLLLLGAGPFTLDNPANQAFVLAANTTGAITYVDSLPLLVSSVAGTNGVVSNNNPISISTVNADLRVSDSRAGADVDAGTSTVALTAGGMAGQDRLLNIMANAG